MEIPDEVTELLLENYELGSKRLLSKHYLDITDRHIEELDEKWLPILESYRKYTNFAGLCIHYYYAGDQPSTLVVELNNKQYHADSSSMYSDWEEQILHEKDTGAGIVDTPAWRNETDIHYNLPFIKVLLEDNDFPPEYIKYRLLKELDSINYKEPVYAYLLLYANYVALTGDNHKLQKVNFVYRDDMLTVHDGDRVLEIELQNDESEDMSDIVDAAIYEYLEEDYIGYYLSQLREEILSY